MTNLHSLIRTCTSQVIDLVDFISVFGIVINASFMECYKCFIYGEIFNSLKNIILMMYAYIFIYLNLNIITNTISTNLLLVLCYALFIIWYILNYLKLDT